MIEWQYVTVGAFALAIGGVIGWYVAVKRKFSGNAEHQSVFIRAVSALLVLLAVGSVLQIFYYQREAAVQADRLQKVTDCQYRINKTLIEALTIRQDATKGQSEALTGMVRAVLNAKSANQTRTALNAFIEATETLNKTRTENPYPTIPSDCRPS